MTRRCRAGRILHRSRTRRTSEPPATPNREPCLCNGGPRDSPSWRGPELRPRPPGRDRARFPRQPPDRRVRGCIETCSSSTIPSTVVSRRLPRTGARVPSRLRDVTMPGRLGPFVCRLGRFSCRFKAADRASGSGRSCRSCALPRVYVVSCRDSAHPVGEWGTLVGASVGRHLNYPDFPPFCAWARTSTTRETPMTTRANRS